MKLSDIAGHLAFGLIALSFLVTDILWLRGISLAASVAAILYNYFAPDRPLWLVIDWNVVFIAVNTAQIVRLLRARRPIELSSEEKLLYDLVFSGLEPRQFRKLAECGRWIDLEPGSSIIDEKTGHGDIFLIARGRAAVDKEGTRVGELGTGAFIGEVSFVRGAPANASVRALEKCRCLVWSKPALDALFEKDETLRNVFQAGITEDLAEKLARQKEQNDGMFFGRR